MRNQKEFELIVAEYCIKMNTVESEMNRINKLNELAEQEKELKIRAKEETYTKPSFNHYYGKNGNTAIVIGFNSSWVYLFSLKDKGIIKTNYPGFEKWKECEEFDNSSLENAEYYSIYEFAEKVKRYDEEVERLQNSIKSLKEKLGLSYLLD